MPAKFTKRIWGDTLDSVFTFALVAVFSLGSFAALVRGLV